MSAPEMTSALRTATWLRDRGWRPIPLDHPELPECAGGAHRDAPTRKAVPCDGKRGKHPTGGWGTQAATEPTDKMLELWFGRDARNVGVACGQSGLLVVDEDELDALTDYATSRGETLPVTYRVRTARGWHWYFDAAAHPELGNSPGLLGEHGMDVRGGRGMGGYVVAAGSVHASGHVYLAEDDHVAPAPLPGWLARDIATKTAGQATPGAPGPIGDWSDDVRHGTAVDLHAQYQRHLAAVRTRGGNFRHELFLAALDGWRLVDLGLLREVEMLTELADQVRRVWGDEPDERDRRIVYTEARDKATSSPWALSGGVKLGPDGPPAGDDTDPTGGEHQQEERSSWAPIDLGPYIRGEVERAQPSVGLARQDGVRLLYPGKEHAVIGEMESGKSWFALACVAAELAAGRRVLYVHFEEDDPTDTVTRLLLLGVTAEELLAGLDFRGPAVPITWDVIDGIAEAPPSLAVLDGQNEAMALHGQGIREEDGAAAYRRQLVKPFTGMGAAVLSCDHVVKDSERSRLGYALGSIHKGNGINGTIILLENEEAFGIGRRGASRVYVTKDRPAQVRQHGQPTPVARKFFMGVMSVDATTEGAPVDLAFWPPRDEQVSDSPFGLEERWHDVLSEDAALPAEVAALRGRGSAAARDIFRVLRYVGAPLTTAQLQKAVGEGPRKHSPSTFFAGRALLVRSDFVDEDGAKLSLEARYQDL